MRLCAWTTRILGGVDAGMVRLCSLASEGWLGALIAPRAPTSNEFTDILQVHKTCAPRQESLFPHRHSGAVSAANGNMLERQPTLHVREGKFENCTPALGSPRLLGKLN
jgi:hypothetical protein